MYYYRPHGMVEYMKKSTICDTSEQFIVQQKNNDVNLITPDAGQERQSLNS